MPSYACKKQTNTILSIIRYIHIILHLSCIVIALSVCLLISRLTPRSKRTDILFPYTTLFRSTANTDLAARVTGMEISAETAVKNLELVGCDVTVDGDRLTATVPSWRPDMSDPFDLVEEIARIVGYDNVPSVLPPAPADRKSTRLNSSP